MRSSWRWDSICVLCRMTAGEFCDQSCLSLFHVLGISACLLLLLKISGTDVLLVMQALLACISDTKSSIVPAEVYINDIKRCHDCCATMFRPVSAG